MPAKEKKPRSGVGKGEKPESPEISEENGK